ncbi:MAG: hypothetical protein ACR2GK_01270 [Gemmatimonadaceae bacterium]
MEPPITADPLTERGLANTVAITRALDAKIGSLYRAGQGCRRVPALTASRQVRPPAVAAIALRANWIEDRLVVTALDDSIADRRDERNQQSFLERASRITRALFFAGRNYLTREALCHRPSSSGTAIHFAHLLSLL